MNQTPLTFTAAQIARALARSKRGVLLALDGVRESGVVMVSGQATRAWSVASLPTALQIQLQERAAKSRFRTIEQLLSAPPKEAWTPRDKNKNPIPLSSLHRDCIDDAARLQRAFAPALARLNDASISAAEHEARGCEEYAREFGHVISRRYWRHLFSRTVERDAGAENWSRLEIYLPDQLKRKAPAVVAFSAASGEDFRELHELMLSFKNPVEPTRQEKALLWLRTFELFEALTDETQQPCYVKSAPVPAKTVRLRLLKFLWKHAPWLAVSANALRTSFDRKLANWRAKERSADALSDGREKKRGVPRAEPYDRESLDRVTWYAVANCGGRISQAVRELIEADQLDSQITAAFLRAPANKSYVPTRLREAVRYDVAALMPEHQGRRAADKMIPPLDLTYEGVHSMQCLQADDFTMPVYFYAADGNGWFRLTRGQVLLAIDWRSLRVLGFCLHPEGQYHSGLIRTLFTRVFEQHGLPATLYLERGIWQKSKLITGDARAAKAIEAGLPFSEAQVEMGLRQFGIDFIHARRARSKPVERVGGLLQDLMHGEPGYCGRDERKDCPEVTTRNKRLVEVRQKHPAELGFYSFEQWEARLNEICERYNSAVQNGKRLDKLSPDEAFARFENQADPPTRFGPEHRYLLAHHKIPVTVKADNKIAFNVRGERFTYFDAQTGRHARRNLIAWFNPEAPDFCTFTDLNMKHPFTVARHNPVNGLIADEAYEVESAKAHAAASHAKARYRVLKAKFAMKFRQTVSTPAVAMLGQQIEQQTEKAKAKEDRRETRVKNIRSRASRLQIPAAVLDESRQTEDGLAMMAEAMRENANAEKEGL